MIKKSLKTPQLKPKESRPAFSIQTFFRAYVNAMKSKALFFNYSCKTLKIVDDFLKCLEKNSRIAGYNICLESQNIKIFLSYDLTQSQPLIPQITYYSMPNRKRSASVTKLQQFQIQNPNALTLIRTRFGIVDLKTCLSHRCGGEFLVTLT